MLRSVPAMKQNHPERPPPDVVEEPPLSMSSLEKRAVAALAGSAFYGALALLERSVTFWHASYRQRR